MSPEMKLEVYDNLREMHHIFKTEVIPYLSSCTNFERMTIDTVDGVLYLAEKLFAEQE